MKLLIISHTSHYLQENRYFGWGPTVKEISQIAKLFDSVIHIAFLNKDNQIPKSFLPYTADNIEIITVPEVGGKGIRAKFAILISIPLWIKIIAREIRRCDVVHVRAPASISLIAIFLLIFLKYPNKRWIKYAGNWEEKKLPLSYFLQRYILHHNLHRGIVTINGNWQDQKKHELSFLNPCITIKEIIDLKGQVERKTISQPIKILFAGSLDEFKRAQYVINAVDILIKKGYSISFTIIGDGSYKVNLLNLVKKLGIMNNVIFCGWLSHNEVKEHMLDSHFLALPSASEGWPKVLSEAMACGALCIAGDISSIPQILLDRKLGYILKTIRAEEIAIILEELINNPLIWKNTILNAFQKAEDFTYENYLERIREEIIS